MRHLLIRTIDGVWLGIGLVWLVNSLLVKRTIRTQSPGPRIVQAAIVLLAFVLLFADRTAVGPLASRTVPDTDAWLLTGTVLTVAGILFALVARFFIGKNWSSNVTLKQDHELIRSGPYSIVRHPIYSGFLLAMLGTAIACGEVRCFVAVTLACIGWKLKSLTEEEFMTEQFGEQYAQYEQQVKALIPFIW